MDKACIEKGKAPPLLTSHEFMIAKEFDKVETAAAKDISQILVRSTILHGKLTELIHNAQDPKSDKGEILKKLTTYSGQTLYKKAAANMKQLLLRLKQPVDFI